MRGRHLMLAVVAGAAVLTFDALRGSAVGAADEAPGKAAFVANKCNLCHAVSSAAVEATTKSEKMKGPDLKG